MIITVGFTILAAFVVESVVLDPALYLAPTPPLVSVTGSIQPGQMWGRSLEERTKQIAKDAFDEMETETTTQKPASVESRMFWPRWSVPQPSLGINIPLTFSLSGSYGKVASVPASVIGNTYATVTGLGTSVAGLRSSVSGIGTSASGLGKGVSGLGASVTGLRTSLGSSLFGKSAVANIYGNYGKSALAGSSYGTYGTSAVRVYGGDNVAAWSGWGNGKWGHYGKG